MLVVLSTSLALDGRFTVGQAQEPPAKEKHLKNQIDLDRSSDADRAIEKRIKEIFSELDGLRSISVRVEAGVVTLSGTVLSPKGIREADQLVRRVKGVVKVRNDLKQSANVEERLYQIFNRFMSRGQDVLLFLPLFVIAAVAGCLIAGIGVLIARFKEPFNRVAPNTFIAGLYRQIVRIGFILIGIVVALDFLDASAMLGTILGAAGVAGLAIGFAVRDTIENYLATIMLSVRQPFRPNDLVQIEGHEGRVIRLTSRATVLMTPDGNHVRIPNATVFKGVVQNFTSNPERRFTFELGIDAESDIDQAIELCNRTLGSIGFVLKVPPPATWVRDVGDSNVILMITGWLDQTATDFRKGRSEAIRLSKDALEQAGFSLPEPIYRLRLANGITGELSDGSGKVIPESLWKSHNEEHLNKQSRLTVSTDISVDKHLIEKANAEREKSKADNFLNVNAPVE